MIFYGFIEKLRFKEPFEKHQIAKNLILYPYSKGSGVIKYFEQTANPGRFYPKCPILVYNRPGPETRDWGLWFAWEEMIVFTYAIRLLTKKDCECNVWFGFDDDKKTPLKEDLWKPKSMFSEEFPSSEKCSYVNKSDFRKIKQLYNNIRPIYLEKSYSKIKNALTFFDSTYRVDAFIYKLMNQSIILESLFSDGDKESIGFKIALRASWFLQPRNKAQRKALFNELKNIYTLRSYLIHGDDYEKIASKFHSENSSFGYMMEVLERLNIIVCEVLYKIFINPELTQIFNASNDGQRKKLKSYLDSIVLS